MINYYWRLFGTALSFGSFGLGGLLMGVTIFPVIYILPVSKSAKVKLSRRAVRQSFRLFIRFMKTMGVIGYDIRGVERLKGRDDLFIVANHPSLLDVVFLISLAELPNCVIKQGVWGNPFMFFVVRAAGFIENSGDAEILLDRCVDALNKGDGLIIFPEGTRTAPDKEIKMRRGCAHIALRARKNLTPVSITCKPTTLTKDHRWYNIPKNQKPHFCISIGEDIEIDRFLDIKDDDVSAVRELTAYMKDRFIKGMACQG